ncbi:C39 family peptidase [Falsibacillus albus]|uniref:C39 family peptidase n=1 Tax=Falsibacillus albus TaxID=2478915 RepID=UPI002D784F78|nr:C39 family peptidase [Falsibacillus albus]
MSFIYLKGTFAKEQTVYHYPETASDTNNHELIKIKNKVLLNASVVTQYPQLARGCEVTSLAMLLQYAGIEKADKMKLAEQIAKDPSAYSNKNGSVRFGNPNTGFVGDIYTYSKPGYGVYHGPVAKLAARYLGDMVIDLTGSSFDILKMYLSAGKPVWVITNTDYKKLPSAYFQTWQTHEGPIKVTFKEHSVLITGYDEHYIYFNDPLTGQKNKKKPKDAFISSWVQMGSQAISLSIN